MPDVSPCQNHKDCGILTTPCLPSLTLSLCLSLWGVESTLMSLLAFLWPASSTSSLPRCTTMDDLFHAFECFNCIGSGLDEFCVKEGSCAAPYSEKENGASFTASSLEKDRCWSCMVSDDEMLIPSTQRL